MGPLISCRKWGRCKWYLSLDFRSPQPTFPLQGARWEAVGNVSGPSGSLLWVKARTPYHSGCICRAPTVTSVSRHPLGCGPGSGPQGGSGTPPPVVVGAGRGRAEDSGGSRGVGTRGPGDGRPREAEGEGRDPASWRLLTTQGTSRRRKTAGRSSES